ncbi:MAG: 50S ribosomal protein L29 [Elusimicrobia bacterium]|nr:50S ribosomal protein L29 [Elusimicrobiota bacterium]
MKAREKDAKRVLSVAELRAELQTTREKHFKLRFKHRAMPVGNPMEIRHLRRHMARLETWIRQKETAGER